MRGEFTGIQWYCPRIDQWNKDVMFVTVTILYLCVHAIHTLWIWYGTQLCMYYTEATFYTDGISLYMCAFCFVCLSVIMSVQWSTPWVWNVNFLVAFNLFVQLLPRWYIKCGMNFEMTNLELVCITSQGDSGGPLICYTSNQWVVVRLTSWGPELCQMDRWSTPGSASSQTGSLTPVYLHHP